MNFDARSNVAKKQISEKKKNSTHVKEIESRVSRKIQSR